MVEKLASVVIQRVVRRIGRRLQVAFKRVSNKCAEDVMQQPQILKVRSTFAFAFSTTFFQQAPFAITQDGRKLWRYDAK